MNKNKHITFTGLLPVLLAGLFAVVLMGCPVAAPKNDKDKGGDDEGEKPYVCPKAQPITATPANRAELETLVNTAIAINPLADLNHIDTSKVTSMTTLFNTKGTFNGDVSCWDTSSVTDMSAMFFQADAFNVDISKWNTGNVTNMNNMFRFATAFNQDLSGWNVKSVANHIGFATNAGFETETEKHPTWP